MRKKIALVSIRKAELRAGIRKKLWPGLARLARIHRDPAVNEAEDLGLIEHTNDGYIVTIYGRHWAHSDNT